MTRYLKASLIIVSIILIVALLLIFKNVIFFSQESNNEVVKIYYADNISPAHAEIIRLFNQKQSGKIEIIPIDLPFSKFTTNERKEILARSLRTKNDRIDIFAVDLIWGPRFAKWSYPLDDHFNQSDLNQFMDHTIQSATYNGQLIAIPLYTDVGLMFFRRDLLKKQGFTEADFESLKESITWKKFLSIGKKFRDKNNPFFIYAADSFEGMICSFHETLNLDEGTSIFDKKQIDLNTKAARKGLQLMVDLISKYKYSPKQVLEFDENQSRMYTLENNAVFVRGWPGLFKDKNIFQDHVEKINHIDVAALPHFEGQENSAVFGGWNLMISKYSKHKKEALEFLKFTSLKETQKILYKKSGYFPALKTVYNDSVFIKNNADLKYFERLLLKGKHRPFKENYTRMSDIMAHYFHKALKNEISVEQALILASEQINSKKVFIK